MNKTSSGSILLFLAGLLVLLISIAPVSAAQFRVYSDPAGASFCVDNHCGYTTPDNFPATPDTWYTILVTHDGYQSWSDTVYLNPVGTTVVNANLVQNPPSYGWLDITSFGADIYVDGIDRGNGNQRMTLSPGSHTLALKKAGYYDYQDVFTISPDRVTTLAPGMTPYPQSPAYGDLQIQSTPPGAAILVNGDYKGTTFPGDPVYVTQLSPGTYTVSLSMPDYQTYTESATVEAGKTFGIVEVMVTAAPGPAPDATGQITAGSNPSGASVFLDGKYKGITPMVLVDIPEGSHTLMLRQGGFSDWVSTVTVTGGGYTAVTGTLVPATPATPQPTKSGLSLLIPLAGTGIGALLMVRKRA